MSENEEKPASGLATQPASPVTVFTCGPPKCEHVWDGPDIKQVMEGGGESWSATCSKCGADAMTVSLWEDE